MKRQQKTARFSWKSKRKCEKLSISAGFQQTCWVVESYLEGDRGQTDDSQIREEIDWLMARYQKVQPMMYIYYNRYSMKGIEDPNVRITIDYDLTYRSEDLSLLDGKHGEKLLPDGYVIMEIKVQELIHFG